MGNTLVFMRQLILPSSLGILGLIWYCCGCERASAPAGAADTTREGASAETKVVEDPLAESPDSVDALVERGKSRYRDSWSKSGQERIRLYQEGWRDFQKAHELAGGTWDFDFKPWEPPDIEKATEQARKHAAAKPDSKGSAAALTEAASLCLQLFRPDQAAILMERARAIAPDDPEVRLVCLGLDGMATGDWARINIEIKQLLDLPELRESYRAWSSYAYGLMSAGDNPGAEIAYRKCLELNPTADGLRGNLVSILAAQDKMEEAEAERAKIRPGEAAIYADLNFGCTYMSKGRFEEALPIMESVAQRAPGLPAAWLNLGECYRETKRFEQAVRVYQYVTQLIPQDPTGFGLLGHTYSEMGKFDEAIETLKQAEKRPNATYSIQLGLTEAYQGAGRNEEAEKALKRAYEMDPGADAMWQMYGTYLRERKRYAELIDLTTQAIGKRPGAAAPYDCRAMAYSGLEDFEQALSDREKFAELASDAYGYYALAYTRKLAGHPNAEIIAALEDALTKNPGHAYASAVLWIVARDAGDQARAERALREAIAQAQPDNWYGRLNRYLAGELSQDQFLGFASNDDERCEAYYFIGEKIRITKGFDAAREWFEKCVGLGKAGFWEDDFSRQILEKNK